MVSCTPCRESKRCAVNIPPKLSAGGIEEARSNTLISLIPTMAFSKCKGLLPANPALFLSNLPWLGEFSEKFSRSLIRWTS